MRTRKAGFSRSIAWRPSMREPIRPIRSPPASKRGRSAASSQAFMIFPIIAAARTRSQPTSRPFSPIAVWRGRVFASLEVTLDALARELRQEPSELRFKSLVRPEQMPFDNIAKRHFDSGDYPESLRRCLSAVDLHAIRERQAR